MFNLKPFVPQAVCLACEGCCRYGQKHSVWSPFFLYAEIKELSDKNLLPPSLFTQASPALGKSARICLLERHGTFFCPCLDEGWNTCKIYADRPLDCQLYPFLLARRGDRVFLAVDEHCPYVKDHLASPEAGRYVAYLKDFLLSPEFQKVVSASPEIVQNYPASPVWLEPLAELASLI